MIIDTLIYLMADESDKVDDDVRKKKLSLEKQGCFLISKSFI